MKNINVQLPQFTNQRKVTFFKLFIVFLVLNFLWGMATTSLDVFPGKHRHAAPKYLYSYVTKNTPEDWRKGVTFNLINSWNGRVNTNIYDAMNYSLGHNDSGFNLRKGETYLYIQPQYYNVGSESNTYKPHFFTYELTAFLIFSSFSLFLLFCKKLVKNKPLKMITASVISIGLLWDILSFMNISQYTKVPFSPLHMYITHIINVLSIILSLFIIFKTLTRKTQYEETKQALKDVSIIGMSLGLIIMFSSPLISTLGFQLFGVNIVVAITEFFLFCLFYEKFYMKCKLNKALSIAGFILFSVLMYYSEHEYIRDFLSF